MISDLGLVFESILRDEDWLKCMTKVDEVWSWEVRNKMWHCEQGFWHAMRTARYAMDFISECESYCGDNDTEGFFQLAAGDGYLAAIAALLHNMGLEDGLRENSLARSQEMARNFLKRYNMRDIEENIIVDAIGNSRGRYITNMVDAALIMGIQMDMTRYRVEGLYADYRKDLLTTLEKEMLAIDKVRYVVLEEDGHGALSWGLVKGAAKGNFKDEVERKIEVMMEECPECIQLPQQVTEEYLGLDFAFFVDDAL